MAIARGFFSSARTFFLPHFHQIRSSVNAPATSDLSISHVDAGSESQTRFLPRIRARKPKEEAASKRERIIRGRLEQFARLPSSDIFDLQPEWNPLGLTDEEARRTLDRVGRNILATERPPTPLALVLSAIWNPFNVLLLVLAVISIATGDHATFAVMMFMVAVSTGLRFWQEITSISQASKLVNSVTSPVRVLRRRGSNPHSPSVSYSEEVEIDRKEVIPGDVLVFTSGDVFPADCVLSSSEALTVVQASLTGELTPVEKSPCLSHPPLPTIPFDILDNRNVCLAGTSVAAGSGRALVILTGTETYMASIAKDLSKTRPLNPMQKGVRNISYLLIAVMVVIAPIVLVIQGVTSKDWKGATLFAISVAVGLTPEMLPMIVTSNLALSAVRVARKKVIVKRFDAIQNLGAVKILCSDKSGTLTTDPVRLSVSTTGSGLHSDLPLVLAYLNSALQTGTRSPLDRAVADCVQEKMGGSESKFVGVENWDKVAEIPFDSSRRLLSILVTRRGTIRDDETLLITKGAVEEILERCSQVYDHPNPSSSVASVSVDLLEDFKLSTTLSLSINDRLQILETAKALNEEGLRLVAVSCRVLLGRRNTPLSVADESDLIFVGFLGFCEVVKTDAAEAVSRLAGLGVQVRILTGDTPVMAAKVARDLGILQTPSSPHTSIQVDEERDLGTLILTGSQLTTLSGDEAGYSQAIERALIYAKLSPHQKVDVIEALRRGGGGRAVAFLGDGVNDALALRAADVGISVDSGTEIAKEAADVILLEKGLDVIAHGVLQGRTTLVNTIKYIKMVTSANFGNVISILIASAWLPYQPMLPLQLLFQNLLYDLSLVLLPWDNCEAEDLAEPRTWDAKSIARFMVCVGPTSTLPDICTFCLNWFRYGIRNQASPFVRRAQTAWFLENLITQLFAVHLLRTGKLPFIQSRASLAVFGSTFFVGCIAFSVPYIPKLNGVLRMEAPFLEFYGFLAAVIVAYSLLVHLDKAIYICLFKEWL